MKAGTLLDPFKASYEGDPMAGKREEVPPEEPEDGEEREDAEKEVEEEAQPEVAEDVPPNIEPEPDDPDAV